MMKWLDRYYLGESIKEPYKIRRKIEAGKAAPGIYLITLSDNPHNLLEILPSVVLLQKRAMGFCPQVVGMARGKAEAMELVSQIIEEIYQETGSFEVEEYIKNR